ncbi:MAG: hypothetical protein IKS55_00150 [Oscillospiraceae bacterium]|nr:hypothetical protein [Oscillospiraceae bacterium]
MKTKKTILSLLLVLALAASLGSMHVFADNSTEPYSVDVRSDDDNHTRAYMGDGVTTINIGDNKIVYDGVSVSASEQNGTETITVDGNIKPDLGEGLTVNNQSSETPVAVNVKGDIIGGDPCAVAVYTPDSNSPGTKININGNVSAQKIGVEIGIAINDNDAWWVSDDEETDAPDNNPQNHDSAEGQDTSGEQVAQGNVSITVNETLKVGAGGTPVLIGSGVTKGNLEITVWKVEVEGETSLKEGSIVKGSTDDGNPVQTRQAEEIEQNIKYIIRIDPDQNQYLNSTKTAHANESVMITVTVPAGKILKSVYTAEGKKMPAHDNGDGTFKFSVPVGGGVYLFADFLDEPTPNFSGIQVGVAEKDKVDVTFDPAGGAWSNGKTDPVVKTGCWDSWFLIPELPTKEDQRCTGWQCDDDEITASEPGKSFCPYKGGNYSFTAVWEDE